MYGNYMRHQLIAATLCTIPSADWLISTADQWPDVDAPSQRPGEIPLLSQQMIIKFRVEALKMT